jgi:hypothetical protein
VAGSGKAGILPCRAAAKAIWKVNVHKSEELDNYFSISGRQMHTETAFYA